MRILLAEDDAMLATLVDTVLTTAGHRLTVVTTADAAIRAIQGETPELVMTNIDLEQRNDGLHLLDYLRPSDLPVVLFTAYGPYAVSEYERLGAAAYLGKPFGPEELMAVVDRFTPR